MEQWWVNTGRGKLKDSERNPSQCHFVQLTFDLGEKPGIFGEKTVTDHLSYSMTTTSYRPLVLLLRIMAITYRSLRPMCFIHIKTYLITSRILNV
jgi:hypothetical protein